MMDGRRAWPDAAAAAAPMVPPTGPPAPAPARLVAPLRAQTFDGARRSGGRTRLEPVGAEARRGSGGAEAARIRESGAEPIELLRHSSSASSSDENNAEGSSSPAPTEDEEDDIASPVVAQSTLSPAPLATKVRAAAAGKGKCASTKKSTARGKKRAKSAKSKSPKKKRAKKVPPSLRYLNFPRPGEAVKEKPSSQYRGVGWRKNERKWAAKLRFDGRNRHLGSFDDEIDAARAYDTAARKHVATDRRHLNFPTEDEKLNEVPLSSYRGVFWHKVTRRWCVPPSSLLPRAVAVGGARRGRNRSIDPPPLLILLLRRRRRRRRRCPRLTPRRADLRLCSLAPRRQVRQDRDSAPVVPPRLLRRRGGSGEGVRLRCARVSWHAQAGG